jgi:hypothetical protein
LARPLAPSRGLARFRLPARSKRRGWFLGGSAGSAQQVSIQLI